MSKTGISANAIVHVFLVLLVFVAGYFINDRLSYLEQISAEDPQVVVVDIGRLATLYPTAATDKEVRQMIDDVGAVIENLEATGFVVLDSESVLAAPEHLYLDPAVLFEQAGIDLTQWEKGGNDDVTDNMP